MKTYKIIALTGDDAREQISEILSPLNKGDKAEVTYPDGSKHIYEYVENWREE